MVSPWSEWIICVMNVVSCCLYNNLSPSTVFEKPKWINITNATCQVIFTLILWIFLVQSFESLWALWVTSFKHMTAIFTEDRSASEWERGDLIPRERTCDKALYSYLSNGEPRDWCWYSHSWWSGVSLRRLTCVTMEISIMKHNKQQIATAISRL